jgi:hypothetical protein
MYYRVIVISEEAKGHVSDKERKLVLNYKSTVELNEFSLQLLLKDFTPYNIIVVKVDKPHNRKGHYYETTDNLNTLCNKIKEFVVSGDVEVEKEEWHNEHQLYNIDFINKPYILKSFTNNLGYTFFQLGTFNEVYSGINHKIACELLNLNAYPEDNPFHYSKGEDWIYIKQDFYNVDIENNTLILTKKVKEVKTVKEHKVFTF